MANQSLKKTWTKSHAHNISWVIVSYFSCCCCCFFGGRHSMLMMMLIVVMKWVTHIMRNIQIITYTHFFCHAVKQNHQRLTALVFFKKKPDWKMNRELSLSVSAIILFNEPFYCHDSSKNAPCHEDPCRIHFGDRFRVVEQLLLIAWCHRRHHHHHFGWSLKMYYCHYYLYCYCDDCCYCCRRHRRCWWNYCWVA